MMTFLYLGRASYLLGSFLAGLSFCTIPSFHHHTWKHQVKRLQTWTVRIFFACSVGFEVPIGDFWTAKVWTRSALFLCALVGKSWAGLSAVPFNALNVATVRPFAPLPRPLHFLTSEGSHVRSGAPQVVEHLPELCAASPPLG